MDMPQRPADENQYFTGGCSHHFMSRVPRLRPLVDLHFLPGGIDVEDSFKLKWNGGLFLLLDFHISSARR
jgi:hypothetical protein